MPATLGLSERREGRVDLLFDFFSLDFVYYPVSWIMWVWYKAFAFLLGPSNFFAWALSVMFLVFTLRAILYKPFVKQIRTTRQMQELQPQIKALQKKYGKDRQRMALEMQKLQREHGFNPILGCLPMLAQIPVFLGLYHVLRSFNRTQGGFGQPPVRRAQLDGLDRRAGGFRHGAVGIVSGLDHHDLIALPRHRQHSVTRFEIPNVGGDLSDRTSHFITWCKWRLGLDLIFARDHQRIGKAEADRVHAYANMSRRQRRRGNVFYGEIRRRPVAAENDCSHVDPRR